MEVGMPTMWIGHTLTKTVKLPFLAFTLHTISLWNCYVAFMVCTVLHIIP